MMTDSEMARREAAKREGYRLRTSTHCKNAQHEKCTGNWKPGKAADRFCRCSCHDKAVRA